MCQGGEPDVGTRDTHLILVYMNVCCSACDNGACSMVYNHEIMHESSYC